MKMSGSQDIALNRLTGGPIPGVEIDGRTTRALINHGWAVEFGTGEKAKVKITTAGRKALKALD